MEYIDISAHHLKDSNYYDTYTKLCHSEETVIHLTFTLNSKHNKADILTQYRMLIKELKTAILLYYNKKTQFAVHPGFRRMMLVPELTKQINIHFHGILIIDKPYIEHFYNEFRKLCYHNDILGRQFSYNPTTDTLKDRTTVARYALKDLDLLHKFPDSEKIYLYDINRKIL